MTSLTTSPCLLQPRSIKITVDSYGAHDNMQVGARDQRSQDWCMGNLDPVGVNCTLSEPQHSDLHTHDRQLTSECVS